ncbi:MAG: glycosyltransferase, partial [Planctomycetaceae bacterium]|nr:glycosyltransferase [Planctomycetaceae bacterium]
MGRADFVIANTQTLAEDFIERLHVPPERVEVITCGYDEQDLSAATDADSLAECDTEGLFSITHTGTFYKQRNPRNFLKGVKRLLEERAVDPARLRINFVGKMNVKDPELTSLLSDPVIAPTVHRQ